MIYQKNSLTPEIYAAVQIQYKIAQLSKAKTSISQRKSQKLKLMRYSFLGTE